MAQVELAAAIMERPVIKEDTVTVLRYDRFYKGDVVDVDDVTKERMLADGSAVEPGEAEADEERRLRERLAVIEERRRLTEQEAKEVQARAEAERDPEVEPTAGSPEADLSIPRDDEGEPAPKADSGSSKSSSGSKSSGSKSSSKSS